MQTKIRLEGEDWNWKEMKRMMKESLELSEEHGPTGLYVPKGNPTKLDYRFKPFRANRLGDTDEVSEHSEQGNDQVNDNNFDLDIGGMTNEEFDQYLGQIYAVRKGGKEGVLKEEGKVKIDAQYAGDTGTNQ